MFRCNINKWLCGISTIFILAGCGGSGGSAGIAGGQASGTAGVAVDPYIVGAVFQEVASDGTIIQRQSTPSDAAGVFSFPRPVTIGSTVEMKVSNKGLHGGAPFQGVLRRTVLGTDAGSSLVVSPLTTLLAGGVMPENAIAALNSVGFSGLTTTDLYRDPMEGLAGLTSGVTGQKLNLLQAAMAVEAYMEISGNFRPTPGDLSNASASGQILNRTAAAMRDILSPVEFTRVSTALTGDPQVTGPPTLGDLILAATQQQQTIITLVRDDMAAKGTFDPGLVDRAVIDGKGQMAAMTKTRYMVRQQQAPQAIAIDGAALYGSSCASCHGALANSSKLNSSAIEIQTAIGTNIGNMGFLNALTAAQVQAIADALAGNTAPAPGITPPPVVTLDGATLYAGNCAGCHGALASTTKPGRTAVQIQTAIGNNIGSMGSLSTLTAAQIQAIASVLPAPPPTNSGPPDGIALYNAECSGCHGPLATTAKPGRTLSQIQTAIGNNIGNMGSLSTLTAAEIQAIASVLPAAPPPPVVLDGAALYANSCASCHGALASTNKPGRTAVQIQTAIGTNIGNMGFLNTLTAAQIQAIASVLPAAPPPPVVLDGAALYANSCASCHGALASTTKPGRTAVQIQTAIGTNIGNMGFLNTLTAAQIQAIASVLPASAPAETSCTSCHGQPPSGSSYPNLAGAHAVHTALASVNNNCGICHVGAAHNGRVDLGIASTHNAKSGPAMPNSNGTCATVSCHGGQTTPVWQTGKIAVDTQCVSCHAAGTGQYNGYYSGQHSLHVNGQGYSCTVCHNPTKLATGHFSNLATATFEQDPANTIGGGSTRVGTYTPSARNATSGTCSSIQCHGSQNW